METTATQQKQRALPVIRSQEELRDALVLFGDRYNVLLPRSLNFPSPLYCLMLEVVHVDNTVNDKWSGEDIYSDDNGKTFTLKAKALNRIARAAGVKWVDPRIETREVDPANGRVTFVAMSVGWEIKKLSGAKSEGRASGFYRYAEDVERGNPTHTEERRERAEAHAETNAKIRATYEALDLLPREMTVEQYGKPFVVPVVVEDIAELAKSNPKIAEMLVAHALGITDQVYGKALTKAPVEAKVEAQTAKILPLTPAKPKEPETGASKQSTPTPAPMPPPPAPALTDHLRPPAPVAQKPEYKITEQEYKESWLQSDPQVRLDECNKLVKEKAYAIPEGKKTPEQMRPDQIVRFMWILYCMTTPKGGA